jgi:putative nucleotidyltransferase with HDIG domain
MIPTREEAWELLNQHTKKEGLVKHMLSVEAAMRAYAEYFREDKDLWGVTGLLHDFDYEENPTPGKHPSTGIAILKAMGVDDAITHAIASHALYMNVPRNTPMERSLFACDELCGLITATALVKPGKTLAEVDVPSVLKKMKDKTFARSVSREDIQLGVAELGIPLEDHVGRVISALQSIHSTLGL